MSKKQEINKMLDTKTVQTDTLEFQQMYLYTCYFIQVHPNRKRHDATQSRIIRNFGSFSKKSQTLANAKSCKTHT